jgi:transcription antitermination factor NusG
LTLPMQSVHWLLPPRISSTPIGTDVAIAVPKMPPSNPSPCWFALTVQPNHEQAANRSLLSQGFDAYLPVYRAMRRWSDRVKQSEHVLFPGYVFCRFGAWDRLRVLQTHGVRSIVGTGKQPAAIEEDEIEALRAVIAAGRTITPWPYVRIGQNVVIQQGPLASLRGIVVRAKNSWRVVVSVDALGTSVAVEVDSEALTPEVGWRYSTAS